MERPPFRIGLGEDVHPIVAGRPLVLGGVRLESNVGLGGHSDGDAVLHAVIDAVLGAAGQPDIGMLFPDSDPRWKGVSSVDLTRLACGPVFEEWELANLDVVVRADAIRIAPAKEAIAAGVARALDVPRERVNVKGKSWEGMGPVGEGRALECHAVACLVRRPRRNETGGLA